MPHQLGHHFIVGLGGTSLSEDERSLLNELSPAGIVLFRHNVDQTNSDWPNLLRTLVAEAKAASTRSTFIVSIDHEGGRVHRLREPTTHFPAAVTWNEDSFAVGARMGAELRSLGINLNFAPDCDILVEPTNTVIGARSLGTDAEVVAEHAVGFLRGMKQFGVAGCAKHFPGHGSTKSDSHFELPLVETDLSTLRSREFIPFTAMIAEGVPIVMTGHLLVPALDEQFPATISKRIITDYLRAELGFQGVVVTDAMEMRAMQHVSPAEKALLSLESGTDLLLLAQPYGETPLELAKRMISELDRHALRLQGALEASAKRIATLFRWIENIEPRIQIEDPFETHSKVQDLALIERLQSRVG